MVGTARGRTMPSINSVGYGNIHGYQFDRITPAYWGKSCQDVIGNPTQDNPLTITEGSGNWSVLNGWNGVVGLGQREYSSYYPNLSLPQHSVPAIDLNALKTKLFATTNPGRSSMKFPVFLAELRELPKLFRLIGNSLLKTGANTYLSSEYGWKILFQDLRRTMQFQKSVMQRMDELRRLQSKSGLKRRKKLSDYSSTSADSNTLYIESLVSTVLAKYSTTDIQKVWGTCRWIPSVTGELPKSEMDRYNLANDLILGLTRGQIFPNIWEALPWSWLIDWFTNIGDLIEANNNQFAVPVNKVNIMVNKVAIRTYRVTSKPSWATMNPETPVVVTEKKERFPSSAWYYPSYVQPILTGRQLSILGAIVAQRFL